MGERFATLLCLVLQLNCVQSDEKYQNYNFSCPIPVVEAIEMNCSNFICSAISAEDKSFIIDYHNSIRNRMAGGNLTGLPTVPNMNEVVWDWIIEDCVRGQLSECQFTSPGNRAPNVAYNTAQAKYTLMNQGAVAEPKVQLMWQTILDFWLFSGLNILPQQWKNVTGSFASSDASSLLTPFVRSLACGMTEQFDGSTYTFTFQCIYFPLNTMSLPGLPYYKEGMPRSQCPSGSSKNANYPYLCGV